MPGRYLVMQQSAVVDQLGSATIQLTPAVGQFWAIAVVRVSQMTRPQLQNFTSAPFGDYQTRYLPLQYPYCSLYVGATGVRDSTTFVDDTTLGSGDSSSIVSGTVVEYGESITARWLGADPGNTVLLNVYGRSFESITDVQNEFAPVPGSRFAGTTANNMVWSPMSITNTVGGAFPWVAPVLGVIGNWEVASVHFTVTTSAVVATRQFGLRFIATNGSEIARIFAPGTQGASGNNVRYTFAQGLPAVSGGGLAFQYSGLPSRLVLQVGYSIQSISINADPGDTWDNLHVELRTYNTFIDMSFS